VNNYPHKYRFGKSDLKNKPIDSSLYYRRSRHHSYQTTLNTWMLLHHLLHHWL
jgi:hypothetical protein